MDLNQGARLVLASASPRRREIFQRAGFQFRVEPAHVDETLEPSLTPSEQVMQLAERKAGQVAQNAPGEAVVGADTLVYLDQELLSKPESPEEAVEMLQRLSGKWHTVYTGYALLDTTKSFRQVQYVATRVEFNPLDLALIREYVATGEPLDKAGAYGIQDRGSLLVRSLDGCYFNVMGFPIATFFLDWQDYLRAHNRVLSPPEK